MKKRKVFEKEVFHLSLYDNFNNYKETNYKIDNKIKINDLKQNNTNNNTNLNIERFPILKKISNLNKALIKEGENDTNGNSLYKNYEQEKKETIISIINSDNSVKLIKKKLTKNNNLEKEKNDEDNGNDNNKFEDKKYLKNLIMKNKMKNRSQIDLKVFDTYNQKNKKILSIIKENFKKRYKNKSFNENVKLINRKNEINLRKRRMNALSIQMNKISHQLNRFNNKLNSYLENSKDFFNKDFNYIFD